MANIKILHIMSGYGGGISSFIKNKAIEMPKHNVLFDVATYDKCSDNFKRAISNTGGNIFQLNNPKKKGWKKFKQSFLDALNSKTYDIIHCHIPGHRSEAYYRLCKKYSQAKFLIHAHSTSQPTNKIASKIEQIISNKNSYGLVGCGIKAIDAVYGEKNNRKKVVIPNSIEAEQFLKSEPAYKKFRNQFREKYHIKQNEFLIGHIGRLHSVKNHKLTLDIAKEIKKQKISAKIIITGEGSNKKLIKETIENYNLENTVHLSGRINPIADYYPALDSIILPSFNEGLPTIAIESQAAGVPIIISDQVTQEVDLGMGLVKHLSLNLDPAIWLDEIMRSKECHIPTELERLKHLNNQFYTNEKSGQLYVNYLQSIVKN